MLLWGLDMRRPMVVEGFLCRFVHRVLSVPWSFCQHDLKSEPPPPGDHDIFRAEAGPKRVVLNLLDYLTGKLFGAH